LGGGISLIPLEFNRNNLKNAEPVGFERERLVNVLVRAILIDRDS